MGEGMTAETPQPAQGMMTGRHVPRAPGSSLGGHGGGGGSPPPSAAAPWTTTVPAAPAPEGGDDDDDEPPMHRRDSNRYPLPPPHGSGGVLFFSPRCSTAAAALSSFSQQQQQQNDHHQYQYQELYRRDFSPPPAFDPPRASTLRPASAAQQRMTEIQPRGGGGGGGGRLSASSVKRGGSLPPGSRSTHRHGGPTPPSFPPPLVPPPYFAVAVNPWQPPPPSGQLQPPHLLPVPFPMPPAAAANAWQQQQQQDQHQQQHVVIGEPPTGEPLSVSSTSMLPDPRVSAIAQSQLSSPAPPSRSGSKKSRSVLTANSASRPAQQKPPPKWGVPSSSQKPLQAKSQNPSSSVKSSRQRPASQAFVTPTPKKLRLLPDPPSVGRLMDPTLLALPFPLPAPLRHSHGSVGTASAFLGGAAIAANAAAAPPPPGAAYSRKTKALGVLADNFCQIFASQPPYTEIIVDSVSTDLGVERRRIYDVVNILESIRVVVKKAKNTYCWMGSGHLPYMFALLQREAFDIYPEDAILNGLLRPAPGTDLSIVAAAAAKAKDTRSLCRLSQHFLQVFLVGNVEISLPEASDKIHGETTVKQLAVMGSRGREPVDVFDAKKFQQAAARGLKTKIRRLYDIANVFISLGILTKLENTGLRSSNDRPTFRWTFNASAADLLRVYETMPDDMKQQQTPFQKSPLALSHLRVDAVAAPRRRPGPKGEDGPDPFLPPSADTIEPTRRLPPQPSPTSSEEADGFVHPPSELLPPLPPVTSMASSLTTTSAAASYRSDSEPRRISFPFPAHLE